MGTYYKLMKGLFFIKNQEKLFEILSQKEYKQYEFQVENNMLFLKGFYSEIKRNGNNENKLLNDLKSACYCGEIIGCGEGEMWFHYLENNEWNYKRIQ